MFSRQCFCMIWVDDDINNVRIGPFHTVSEAEDFCRHFPGVLSVFVEDPGEQHSLPLMPPVDWIKTGLKRKMTREYQTRNSPRATDNPQRTKK